MATSIATMSAVIRISALEEGTRFYASDLGLNGGTIQSLYYYDYIDKTGNTKSYFIELGDDYYKKVEVYEWEVCFKKGSAYMRESRQREVKKYVKEIKEAYKIIQELNL